MSKPRVIVIGAGLSGMSAAEQLKDKAEVLVLEGRDRLGGRTWTAKLGDGTPLDMGAAFLHGDGPENPMLPLVRRCGIVPNGNIDTSKVAIFEVAGPTGRSPTQSRRMGTCEMLWPFLKWGSLESALDGEAQKARARGQVYTAEQGLKNIKSGFCCFNYNYDAQDQKTRSVIRTIADMLMALELVCPLDQLDLAATPGPATEMYSGNQFAMPTGGWMQLVEYLSKGIDIRYNSKVTAVRNKDGGGAEVELASGERLECAACVGTFPIGVLKAETVAFHPPLPESKVKAIDGIGCGVVIRIAVRFDRCFWTDEHMFQRMQTNEARRGPDSLEFPGIFNWRPTRGTNTLEVLTANEHAAVAEKMSDEELSEWVKTLLGTMFPKAEVDSAKVLEVKVARWGSDEFSRCSYSCPKVGFHPSFMDDVAAPHGSIFFAGEHTWKTRPSTVEGAWQSGLRAAREVAAHLEI